jgi:hypothetical protein
MRVVTNESLIKSKAGMVRNAMTVGLVMLAVAAVAAFQPRYVAYAYASLLISFPLVNWGGRGAAKWLRSPRPDQVIAKTLKSLEHSCQLFCYVLPAENVLLCRAGLFVLCVKTLDGAIVCRGAKWRRRLRLSQLLAVLYDERLGNPTRQARRQAEKLHAFVAAHLPEVNVTVRPIVVFTSPQATLEVVEPAVPAMLVRDLKAHLRGIEATLASPDYKALTNLFNEQVH